MINKFLVAINMCELNKDNDDRWVWRGKTGNVYSVKDVYCKILEGMKE